MNPGRDLATPAHRAPIQRLRAGIKAIAHPCIAPFAIRAFRAKARACEGWEGAWGLAESFSYGRIRIRPMQVRAEVASFFEKVEKRSPRVVLEIGTANGGTLFLFTRVATPEALLISVDLPGGRFGGGYPAWRAGLYKAFAHQRQRIELLRVDSHDPRSLESVRALLGGRGVDLLFIDGDHSFEGVRSDFEMYAPLVRPGGIIALHDIVAGPETNVGEVPRFWSSLSQRPGALEIVHDRGQGGYGIGLIPAL